MIMDTQKHILIEQRVANDGKSKIVAYLLWLLLGGLGLHRFYLGYTGSGIAMIALMIVGLFTGGILLIPLIIWVLIDLFLIPGMVDKSRDALRTSLQLQYGA